MSQKLNASVFVEDRDCTREALLPVAVISNYVSPHCVISHLEIEGIDVEEKGHYSQPGSMQKELRGAESAAAAESRRIRKILQTSQEDGRNIVKSERRASITSSENGSNISSGIRNALTSSAYSDDFDFNTQFFLGSADNTVENPMAQQHRHVQPGFNVTEGYVMPEYKSVYESAGEYEIKEYKSVYGI